MKSKKVEELIGWLNGLVRYIDTPRSFSSIEVERLTEIAEIEASGDSELLEEKVIEFKSNYGYCKPIR